MMKKTGRRGFFKLAAGVGALVGGAAVVKAKPNPKSYTDEEKMNWLLERYMDQQTRSIHDTWSMRSPNHPASEDELHDAHLRAHQMYTLGYRRAANGGWEVDDGCYWIKPQTRTGGNGR